MGLPGLIGRAIAFLATLAGAKFGASKALMVALITTVLGVVLYNLGVDILEELLQWVVARLGAVSTPGAPAGLSTQLTGLLGWFAAGLRIPECVSFIVSIVLCRFTIKTIAGLVPGLGGIGG